MVKRVLGIDPGSQRTGWGIVETSGTRCTYVASGVIDLRKVDGLWGGGGAFADAAGEVSALLDKFKPDAAAIESVFHGKNAKSALVLGQARGAVLSVLGQASLQCIELAPSEIKLSVAGHGKADKVQIAQMVERLLLIEVKGSNDESDALAIAIAGGSRVATSTQAWMTKQGLR